MKRARNRRTRLEIGEQDYAIEVAAMGKIALDTVNAEGALDPEAHGPVNISDVEAKKTASDATKAANDTDGKSAEDVTTSGRAGADDHDPSDDESDPDSDSDFEADGDGRRVLKRSPRGVKTGRIKFSGLTDAEKQEVESRRRQEEQYKQEMANCQGARVTTPQEKLLHKEYIVHTQGELYAYTRVSCVDVETRAKVVAEQESVGWGGPVLEVPTIDKPEVAPDNQDNAQASSEPNFVSDDNESVDEDLEQATPQTIDPGTIIAETKLVRLFHKSHFERGAYADLISNLSKQSPLIRCYLVVDGKHISMPQPGFVFDPKGINCQMSYVKML
ncbi:hypothetical protein PRZ48_004269 [Zasmidium cellare]|uniref:Uncharacterized protein n=1 Tax=Zasmidium cellare TaxID=395010 RepID=A0ABR0EPQ2_ZASCE|nr:hypothetical protein PRZ48_004269 [Zasmidium cellare]